MPTLLYAVVYLNFTFAVFGGFQLETIQAFFSTLAAGAFLEMLGEAGDWRDAFTAGLASGVAAMLKPTGLSPRGSVDGGGHALALSTYSLSRHFGRGQGRGQG